MSSSPSALTLHYSAGMRFSTMMLLWGVAVASALLGTAWLLPPGQAPQLPVAVASPFVYAFDDHDILQEAGSMQESDSPYWWLDSGGELIMTGDGTGETMQGDASIFNRWRIAYALTNPLDTDGGTHPQNIFRLVTKSAWDDVSQQISFFIVADNVSESPNRNQSNGLFLMSRYESGQTLYYAGVRVDGTAVIKKKYHGIYYTLAQETVFPGEYSIEPAEGASQDLLPHGAWLGLRSDTHTNPDGSVAVTLYIQDAGSESWRRVLQAVDAGGEAASGTPPIVGAHYAGIRTDFMDVRFGPYRAETIE